MSALPTHDSCITCGDVALPLAVVDVIDESTACCAAGDGGVEHVAVDLVGPVAVGDVVLVHAGVALAKLGEVDS